MLPSDSTHSSEVSCPSAGTTVTWVLSSFVFFLCTGYVSLYLTPKPCQGRKEWKWKNISCSLVHSFITGIWSLLCFYRHPTLSEDLISTYSPFSHALVSVSIGYFMQDIADMFFNNRNRQSFELMGHHFVVMVCFGVSVFLCQYIGYAVVALIVEINSVFLHIRQLLQLVGLNKSNNWYRWNSLINVGTFVIFRIVTLAWMTRWLAINRDLIPLPFFALGSLGMAIMTAMNIILFCRILNRDFFSPISDGQASSSSSKETLFQEKVE